MSSLIYVEGYDWERLKKEIKEYGGLVRGAADDLTSTVAAEGRKAITDIEEGKFNLGGISRKFHWDSGTKRYVMHHKGGTTFDSALGGYRTRSKDLRMMQYNFENKAYLKKQKKVLSNWSKTTLFSRNANLWENTTKMYDTTSPAFSYNGGKLGFITKRREGKNYFLSQGVNAINQKLPIAISKAMARLEENIKRVG